MIKRSTVNDQSLIKFKLSSYLAYAHQETLLLKMD